MRAGRSGWPLPRPNADKLAAETVCERERSAFTQRPATRNAGAGLSVRSPGLVSQGVRCLASRLPWGTARAVIVASTVDELPAFCTSVVQVGRAIGFARRDRCGRHDRRAAPPRHRSPTSRKWWSWAQSADPSLGSAIPTMSSRQPHPPQLRSPDKPHGRSPDTEDLERAWQQARLDAQPVLGATENGALEVDMIADGPRTR